jgi:hypothetical protein
MKFSAYDIFSAFLGLEGLMMVILALMGIVEHIFIGLGFFVPFAVALIQRFISQSSSEKNAEEDERLKKIRGEASEAAIITMILIAAQVLFLMELIDLEINFPVFFFLVLPSVLVYLAVLGYKKYW